jgi:hypothetical protein
MNLLLEADWLDPSTDMMEDMFAHDLEPDMESRLCLSLQVPYVDRLKELLESL